MLATATATIDSMGEAGSFRVVVALTAHRVESTAGTPPAHVKMAMATTRWTRYVIVLMS